MFVPSNEVTQQPVCVQSVVCRTCFHNRGAPSILRTNHLSLLPPPTLSRCSVVLDALDALLSGGGCVTRPARSLPTAPRFRFSKRFRKRFATTTTKKNAKLNGWVRSDVCVISLVCSCLRGENRSRLTSCSTLSRATPSASGRTAMAAAPSSRTTRQGQRGGGGREFSAMVPFVCTNAYDELLYIVWQREVRKYKLPV